jgi:hypothetical protein
MTEGFQTVLAAGDEERRDLFVGAANRLGTNEQNIEKEPPQQNLWAFCSGSGSLPSV